MDIQKNIRYNMNIIQSAYCHDNNEMATIMGVSHSSVSQKNNGKARYFIEEIVKVSNHFGIDLNNLVKGKLKITKKIVEIGVDMDALSEIE